MLVLVLLSALCVAFFIVAWKARGTSTARALVWTIDLSLLFLTARTAFSVVSVFDNDNPAFNPVTGRIVYQVTFVFLPGALLVAAMVVGGIMTGSVQQSGTDQHLAVPLT